MEVGDLEPVGYAYAIQATCRAIERRSPLLETMTIAVLMLSPEDANLGLSRSELI